MPKSKRRVRKPIKVSRRPKITVIRCSESELRLGAESMLARDTETILEMIKERKTLKKGSNEYDIITYQINSLVRSYNLTAELWGCPII